MRLPSAAVGRFSRCGARPPRVLPSCDAGLARKSILAALLAICLLAGCAKEESPADAGELLKSGWQNYQVGEFDRAIEDFGKVVASAPQGSENSLRGLYALATTWALRRPDEDRAKAAGYYRQVVESGADQDMVAWSLLGLARLEDLRPIGQTSETVKVRAAYQKVIDRFPHHPAGEEAFLFQQAEWLLSGTPEDAAKALANLERFLETHPDSKYLSGAYGLMSSALGLLDRPGEALRWSIKSLGIKEVDPLNPRQDNAGSYWGTAMKAQFDLGDFALAREYYGKLIEEYPTDQRVFPAKMALKNMDETEARIRAGIEKERRP